jgi:hypothetical protein
MSNFRAVRVTRQYTQTNHASPQIVFPLLCPVRESDWVPEWQYRLIYSKSGFAEEGCIFTTPNSDRTETTWVVTEYDPASFHVGFVWMWPNQVAARINIGLTATPMGTTRASIHYAYTGLSIEGNREVGRYSEAWFEGKMRGWEAAINHYLTTGKKISAEGWE